jgi:hypothetical protein
MLGYRLIILRQRDGFYAGHAASPCMPLLADPARSAARNI